MIWSATTRKERRLAGQLPDVAAGIARMIDSGSTLVRAIEELSQVVGPPVADELARVSADITFGMSFDRAMRRWSERSGRSDVQLLVVACRVGSAEGGDIVVALEGASAALNDSLEMADEAAASSSQARASALVLTVLPVVGLVLFTLLEPSVGAYLIGSRSGWILLVSGVMLDGLGLLTMMAMIGRSLR